MLSKIIKRFAWTAADLSFPVPIEKLNQNDRFFQLKPVTLDEAKDATEGTVGVVMAKRDNVGKAEDNCMRCLGKIQTYLSSGRLYSFVFKNSGTPYYISHNILTISTVNAARNQTAFRSNS